MEHPMKAKDIQKLAWKVAALNRFISHSTDKCLPFFNALLGSMNFECTPECKQVFQDLKKYLINPPLLSKPLGTERLFTYLAVLEVAITSVLLIDIEGVQKPIYYVE